ncbi:MAG: hypothetical protein JXR76_05850 [Deltaproteobacteria bacterium]|nr:hypothetical protein [Deltaproteobacteria bacterium]
MEPQHQSPGISQHQLETILNSGPVPIMLLRDNLWRWQNPAATKRFGTGTPGQPAESLVQQLVPDTNQATLLLHLLQVDTGSLDSHGTKPLRLELRGLDGGTVRCEVASSPVNEWTILYLNAFGCTFQDGELLNETHKMASLGRLAEGMAHEINNPLAAIGQNLQLILNRMLMRTRRNHSAAETAGTTLQAIELFLEAQGIPEMFEAALEHHIRAGNIVHQMMAFAPNEFSHRYMPQDLGELIEHAIFLARKDYFQNTALGLQHIDVQVHIDAPLPKVVCQAWKITQSLFAIIKNAAEAIGGQRSGEPAGLISISATQQSNRICIQICDNGVGMDSNTQEKIFEPYFTTKKGNLGTGLGLATCYYVIVQEHSGEISVHSTPGKGTEVTIVLPLQSPAVTGFNADSLAPGIVSDGNLITRF